VEGVLFQGNDDVFRLGIEGVARYAVEGGARIVVDASAEAAPREVRVFLLGSVFGALLHQRGALPLHAGGIETPSGAVLFSGPSGHGKSTLTSAFAARGYPILSDDISRLGLGAEGQLMVWPSFPQVKLWADSAELLGRSVEGLERIRPGRDKYAIAMREAFAAGPLPVRVIYELTPHFKKTTSLEPLGGNDAFSSVVHNTYRRGFLGPRARVRHFALAAAAAKAVRVVRVFRPMFPLEIDTLVDLLAADFELGG